MALSEGVFEEPHFAGLEGANLSVTRGDFKLALDQNAELALKIAAQGETNAQFFSHGSKSAGKFDLA